MMNNIRHLDVYGNAGEMLFFCFFASDYNNAGDGSDCANTQFHVPQLHVQQVIKSLPSLLQNVETLTFYVNDDQEDKVRQRAANLAYHHTLLHVFPKLKTVLVGTGAGVKIIDQD